MSGGPGYSAAIPFSGKYGIVKRFEALEDAKIDLNGQWQTSFINKINSSPAIGIFEQIGNYITGTFKKR